MSASKAQQIVTAKRRAQAVELTLAGLTQEQIANQLGYKHRGHVGLDIKRAFEQAVMERNHQADILLEEKLAILARMRRAVWAPAVQGDLRAVEVVLKIVDRECKLLRLDPTVNVSVEVSTVDAIERQIRDLTKQISLESSQYEWSDDEPGSVQAVEA